MKNYAKYLVIGAAAAILVGCSSTGAQNGNVSVNEPYAPDVGTSANQGTSGQYGVNVYNPTNTLVEPSGAGTPDSNR